MRLTLKPDVTIADTPGGTVLLDGRTGRFWQLNASGGLVLKILNDGGDADQAVQALAERYPAHGQRFESDVAALIERLREAGLAVSS